jgi:hypothetical protein
MCFRDLQEEMKRQIMARESYQEHIPVALLIKMIPCYTDGKMCPFLGIFVLSLPDNP